MSLELANEIWTEIKLYINVVDRQEAADTMVNILIENGHDSEAIHNAFRNDSDIKRSLSVYRDDNTDLDDEDLDEEFDLDDR